MGAIQIESYKNGEKKGSNLPLLSHVHSLSQSTIVTIKKRDGRIAPFDITKVASAVYKALSQTEEGSLMEAARVAENVYIRVGQLKNGQENFEPTVESVQDLVEEQLILGGFVKTAKAYILYRQEHAEQREEKKIKMLKEGRLKVQKRNGKLAKFSGNEVKATLMKYLAPFKKQIDIKELADEVTSEVKKNVFDRISTKEINQIVLLALRSRIERDTPYSFVASRFLLNDLYKEVLTVDELSSKFENVYKDTFEKNIKKGVAAKRYDKRLLDFDFAKLSRALNPKRDFLLNYLGAETLRSRYLIEDYEKHILEVPQYFWMRVCMGLCFFEKEKETVAIEFYNTISQFFYVPSTPTLFQSGTVFPQLSSCYLNTITDDLSHIFKVYGDNAQLSKFSGGIGTDMSYVRATGALIKTTNVSSQGVIPFLNIYDATTSAINRSGKRRGAACVYLETWHYDIESFLELRKNTGDERRRTHDTNTANWIPDLFMKRVLSDSDWTLFSPDETLDLHDLYGKKFQKRYEEYEELARRGKIALTKTMKAKDLWKKMITMLYETGHPWMVFKDPCNVRSPQDHVGVVHSSNLCTEITLNTSKDETAVCNLGSVNLVRHVVNGKLDRTFLEKTIKTAMRMLDNVIDVNFYPTIEAQNSNMRHRPVGLGVMGFTDLLFEMNMAFDTDDAVALSDEIQELISYHAITASCELAKEKGTYESFKGSKWDRGIFPLDTVSLLEKERGMSTQVPRGSKLNWDKLKKQVKQYGMRNSNTMAIAPTSNLANVAGCVAFSIEPVFKNLFVKSNVVGEFTVLNHYLVGELKKHKLWDNEMLTKLKQTDGSIQSLSEVPVSVREKYKESFEIDPIWLVKHAAARGKWIDQSQSLNIFTKSTSGRDISDIYLNAWKWGLKSTYYLRTLGASGVEKSTIELTENANGQTNGKSQLTAEAVQAVQQLKDKEVEEEVKAIACNLGEECEVCQ